MQRKLRTLFLILAVLAVCLPASATPKPVHFQVTASPSPARAGEIVTVTVQAAVDAGWHLYSVVAPQGGPSASAIVSAGGWEAVGPTREDDPVTVLDPNFNLRVAYHEGHAQYTRQFRVPAGLAAGSAALPVTFHYQTCNDHVCLPPMDVSLPLTEAVEAGAARSEYTTPSTAPATTANLSAPAAGGAAPGSQGGWGVFLLAAIAGGLLALLTPCVFPMVPITLTAFVKQSEGDRAKLVRLSGGYALGIIGLYVGVGAIASLTLGAAGANTIAANPWVNLVEFVVFVLFALSFFEILTIRLPAKLDGLQSTLTRHGGNASLFAMGIAFVLASFTCTAPFIGTLLLSAANGNWTHPLVGMIVFATAFSSPFLFFAAFPQWISRLPRSGVWLARTKAALGFVELAAAFKFLSNADQVWQWKLLTQPVLLAIWAVICVGGGLYLLGIWRFGVIAETEPRGAKPTPLRAVFGSAFVAAAAVCVWGLFGRSVGPLDAFLPPAGYGGYGRENTLPWDSHYDAAFASARAKSRLLLVDFTGYACTNCRYNEKNVFPRPEIQKAMAAFERVQLYTDGGADGPKNQQLQQAKLGDLSLPLYAVIDPATGNVVSQIAGVVTPAQFKTFLADAQAQAHAAPAKAWSPFDPAALGGGKPAVVDFTAAWCVNCKAIEHKVFENPDVKPILESQYTTLRGDMTDWDGSASQAIRKKYGIDSLPAVLLFDGSGKEIRSARITGQVSPQEFLAHLQKLKG